MSEDLGQSCMLLFFILGTLLINLHTNNLIGMSHNTALYTSLQL